MTIEDIEKGVATVKRDADSDEEAAHYGEDKLHQAVLRHIAAEAPEPFKEMARLALTTLEIKFPRWCV